jgi:hypothetical protein
MELLLAAHFTIPLFVCHFCLNAFYCNLIYQIAPRTILTKPGQLHCRSPQTDKVGDHVIQIYLQGHGWFSSLWGRVLQNERKIEPMPLYLPQTEDALPFSGCIDHLAV